VLPEDDVHVQPGFAALLSGAKWPPKDAHAVKLDTYFQKVRLGERLSASGGREIARLYSRHESAAAISSAATALRATRADGEREPVADYAVFPNSPRRLGLSIYQLVPAIAIQDHLLKDGKRFATAMTKTDARAAAGRSSVVGKLGREGARLAGQFANLGEWAFQKAFLRVETTTVELE
jgi:hypothetical protein